TLGEKLKDMGYGTGLWRGGKSPYYAVKVPVYSFLKLHGILDVDQAHNLQFAGKAAGIIHQCVNDLLAEVVRRV
ncbi:hypothetical protein H6B10_17410, partial [Gemmiger formicilis]|uniref:hypothetical protein n=1 Tax=Gemmiger formicilis TaxID=745368 RepID=UPI0019594D6B